MSKQDTVFHRLSVHFRGFVYLIAPALIAVGLLLAMPGCERDEIRSYRTPKDPTTTSVAASGQSEAPPASAQSVVWALPADWLEAPNTESMRLATFSAGPDGVEVSLSAFPGAAGGVLSNINRWRGQLGMEPTDEAGLVETMESSVNNGASAAIVDLQSPDGQRMLGAIVDPGDGKTWFVKANGGSDSLDAITATFGEFARSIHLSTEAVDPHAGHNHPPESPSSQGSVDQRLAEWSPPSTWAPEEGASPILSASFIATNESGGARITVTRLGGNGGGSLPNVNRWRAQLGLPPVEQLDSAAGVIRESPLVVDLESTDAANRMLAAIVPAGDSMYYFKMMGSSAGAGAEIENFNHLVEQVGIGETDQ